MLNVEDSTDREYVYWLCLIIWFGPLLEFSDQISISLSPKLRWLLFILLLLDTPACYNAIRCILCQHAWGCCYHEHCRRFFTGIIMVTCYNTAQNHFDHHYDCITMPQTEFKYHADAILTADYWYDLCLDARCINDFDSVRVFSCPLIISIYIVILNIFPSFLHSKIPQNICNSV